MFEKSIPVIVQAAVRTELTNARKTYGDFYANAHEGFGVLYEEYHEAASEMRDLESLIREQLIEDIHENDDQATAAPIPPTGPRAGPPAACTVSRCQMGTSR